MTKATIEVRVALTKKRVRGFNARKILEACEIELPSRLLDRIRKRAASGEYEHELAEGEGVLIADVRASGHRPPSGRVAAWETLNEYQRR